MMCTSIMEASLQLIVETNSNNNTVMNLKSASNLNGNLNCSKELEHYAS